MWPFFVSTFVCFISFFYQGGPATIEGSNKSHPETDNFESVRFTVNGVEYYSPENYFQCQKSVGVSEKEFEETRKSGCGCDVWMAGMR